MRKNLYAMWMDSPLGMLTLIASDEGLEHLVFGVAELPAEEKEHPYSLEATRCLKRYFAGEKEDFSSVVLHPRGTEFQRKVWRLLTTIPYGTTKSYLAMARMISERMSAQAIGQAVGANPIPVIIPCHRVIASNGTIGGFTSGLPIKEKLLSLEHISVMK